MSTIFENELYKGLYHTLILMIILIAFASLAYVLLVNNPHIDTNKKKIKSRLTYLVIALFVLFSAKIWVQGFTHIFYGLSLVAVGLVVTNKESIMNLVGSVIISWRGLFSEGDFIEIGEYKGLVYDLGVLYFKLLEASNYTPNRGSGKFIKIPNGTVITTVVKRYSLERHMIEQKLDWLVPLSIDLNTAKLVVKDIVDNILSKQALTTQPLRTKRKNSGLVEKYIYQPAIIQSEFCLDKPEHLKMSISYYCRIKDKIIIGELIREKLLEQKFVFGLKPDIPQQKSTSVLG